MGILLKALESFTVYSADKIVISSIGKEIYNSFVVQPYYIFDSLKSSDYVIVARENNAITGYVLLNYEMNSKTPCGSGMPQGILHLSFVTKIPGGGDELGRRLVEFSLQIAAHLKLRYVVLEPVNKQVRDLYASMNFQKATLKNSFYNSPLGVMFYDTKSLVVEECMASFSIPYKVRTTEQRIEDSKIELPKQDYVITRQSISIAVHRFVFDKKLDERKAQVSFDMLSDSPFVSAQDMQFLVKLRSKCSAKESFKRRHDFEKMTDDEAKFVKSAISISHAPVDATPNDDTEPEMPEMTMVV